MKLVNYKNENFMLRKGYYGDGSIAIQAYSEDGSPYATLTVCLGKVIKENQAYINIEYDDFGVELIEATKIGKFTGEYSISGYCKFPLYEFSEEILKEME